MGRLEVVLTGTGGQGLILAAIMLAEAAVDANLNVVQTQSYGPEARGGASRAEVIISQEAIYYPRVLQPELVLTMSEAAYKKYGLNLPDNAVLIVDSTYVHEMRPRTNAYYLPISHTAQERIGSEQSANVMALGLLAAVGIAALPFSLLKSAVERRSPRGSAAK